MLTDNLAAQGVSGPVRALVDAAGWAWFDANPDVVVLQVLFFKRTVRDCEPLFVMLFGPRP